MQFNCVPIGGGLHIPQEVDVQPVISLPSSFDEKDSLRGHVSLG